jgi:hypothetical protein
MFADIGVRRSETSGGRRLAQGEPGDKEFFGLVVLWLGVQYRTMGRRVRCVREPRLNYNLERA